MVVKIILSLRLITLMKNMIIIRNNGKYRDANDDDANDKNDDDDYGNDED